MRMVDRDGGMKMERVRLEIAGMSCGHCARAVENALRGLDGVRVERVEIGGATVAYDRAKVERDALTRAVEAEGYTVSSLERV